MLFRSNDTATTEIYPVPYTLSLHDALPIFLEELAFFSKELTVLGVYPAHQFRETFKEAKD